MAFSQLFLGFLQPVAMGSAAVLILLFLVGLRTSRRSSTLINRETSL